MNEEKNRKILLVLAFLAVYIIWGSTYLAIRFAIETLPPFLMAGIRFLCAGALFFCFVPVRDRKKIPRAHWKNAAIVGALLLFGGNGAVVYAEKSVPSGIAALVIATVALWMMLLEWLWLKGPRPGMFSVAGLISGFAGLCALVRPETDSVHVPAGGIGLLLCGALSWAIGSIYSRRAPMPENLVTATAMQMIAGGICLLLAGTLAGEWVQAKPETFTLKSLAAFFYLIFFGALGFISYIYMLKNTSPTLAATYAYVNPLIAVLLGSVFGGEKIDSGILLSAGLIILAVALISLSRKKKEPDLAGD